jgi:toxin FitB
MFLLDTNIVSELRRLDKANPNVAKWAAATRASDKYISAITVLEAEIGILLVSRRDKTQGSMLRHWFDNQLIPGFKGRILSVGADVAIRCAALHVPNPQPEYDALIAATALVHGMTVVTRNVRDFAPAGVKILNPFDP